MKRSLGLIGAILALSILTPSGGAPASRQGAVLSAPRFDVAADFGRMPLAFVPRGDAAGGPASYVVQGRSRSIAFAPEGLTYVLTGAAPGSAGERWAVKLDFIGADPKAGPKAGEKSGTVLSYFRGAPDQWRTGVPAYSRITYAGLWPGIDLV